MQDNGASVGFALAGKPCFFFRKTPLFYPDRLSILTAKPSQRLPLQPDMPGRSCTGAAAVHSRPQIHRLTMMCLSAGGIFLCLGNLGTQ